MTISWQAIATIASTITNPITLISWHNDMKTVKEAVDAGLCVAYYSVSAKAVVGYAFSPKHYPDVGFGKYPPPDLYFSNGALSGVSEKGDKFLE